MTITECDFTAHSVDSAPEPVRHYLSSAERQFGFIPQPLARMASSPGLVEAFHRLHVIFESRTQFSALEREVLVMTVAAYNGCHYCVAMHTAQLHQLKVDPAVIRDLREQKPLTDSRLRALAEFTRRVLEGRGEAGRQALTEFFAAGYTSAHALDAILGVATYCLTTYANRLTNAPLDSAFSEFRWEGVSPGDQAS